MNQAPDIIERCLAIVSSIASLSAEQLRQADGILRKEIGNGAPYVRKRSPFYRDEIRARYDGTTATARALALEFGINERTVFRIGIRRVLRAAVAPSPSPKLTGKKPPKP